jgi:hypothetical protein
VPSHLALNKLSKFLAIDDELFLISSPAEDFLLLVPEYKISEMRREISRRRDWIVKSTSISKWRQAIVVKDPEDGFTYLNFPNQDPIRIASWNSSQKKETNLATK